MDHPHAVRRGQPLAGLRVHRDDLAPRPRPLVLPRRERVALDPRHHDHDLLVVRDHVVNLDHVGVIEPGERARLDDQPLVRTGVGLAPRMQHLERDLPVQLGIVRRIHDPHPAIGAVSEKHVAPEPRRCGAAEQRLLGALAHRLHAQSIDRGPDLAELVGRQRARILHALGHRTHSSLPPAFRRLNPRRLGGNSQARRTMRWPARATRDRRCQQGLCERERHREKRTHSNLMSDHGSSDSTDRMVDMQARAGLRFRQRGR